MADRVMKLRFEAAESVATAADTSSLLFGSRVGAKISEIRSSTPVSGSRSRSLQEEFGRKLAPRRASTLVPQPVFVRRIDMDEDSRLEFWGRWVLLIFGSVFAIALLVTGFAAVGECHPCPWLPSWAVITGVICVLAVWGSILVRWRDFRKFGMERLLYGIIGLPTAVLYMTGFIMLLSLLPVAEYDNPSQQHYCRASLVKIVAVTLLIQPAIIGFLCGTVCWESMMQFLRFIGLRKGPRYVLESQGQPMDFAELVQPREEAPVSMRSGVVKSIRFDDTLSPIEKVPKLPMVH